jgi:transcriptional regulatory protein LevR
MLEYIRSMTSNSGLSCSVMLSDMLSLNIFTSFILGTLGLALYHVELCHRQMVMKSLRHLNVRKPLHACMACRSNGRPAPFDSVRKVARTAGEATGL